MKFAKPAAVALLAAICLAADKPTDDQLPLDPVDAPRVRAEAAKAAADVADTRAKMAADQARVNLDLQDQVMVLQGQKRMAAVQALQAPLKLEKSAYIGIGTAPATPDLREQLKIARGMGLLVTQIEPDSPGAAAGVQVHDILEKLNDQLLINPQQFAALVRSYNPSDQVTLSLIRQNQRQQIKIKLAEKELPPLDALTPPQYWPRVILQQPMGMAGVMAGGGNGVGVAPGNKSVRFGARVMQSFDNVTGNAAELTDENGQRKLKVTSRDGKTIFDGPVDTDEQRKALPNEAKDVLKRIDAMPTPAPMRLPAAAGIGWAKAGGAVRTTRAENLPGRLDAMTLSEDDMTLVLTVKTSPQQGRLLNLVAEDPDGKVLFEGPINTDDEQAAMPKDVRKKLSQPGVAAMLDKMRSDGNDNFNATRAR